MKRWPRPPRLLLMLLVFVAAGAIVNVAVAWGCALRRPDIVLYFAASQKDDLTFARSWVWQVVEDRAGATRLETYATTYLRTGHATIPSESVPAWSCARSLTSADLQRNTSLVEEAAGWPSRSLRWSALSSMDREVQWIHRGIEMSNDATVLERRVLPLGAIWPGFAINTVFYAFILWLLFAAPFALRRRRRIMRGLCPECAYPVGTNDVCTECGTAVAPPID